MDKFISIPVEEYKGLIQAQIMLATILHANKYDNLQVVEAVASVACCTLPPATEAEA